MLSLTILTLLLTSNVISRIQAEKQEERKSQFSGTQTPVYKSGSVIKALQKRDTLNIVPESYVEQTNHMDESQRGKRLQRALPNFDNFLEGLDENLSSHYTTSNKTGPVNYFGSQVYQRNVSYNIPESDGQNVYGSVDVQIGNTFPDYPNGINVYGPIVTQENNTYRGNNKNALYGASITQIGNTYPENAGKNDIFSAVVVQKNNIYEGNPENKTMVGVIINQSNNTYSKSIEGIQAEKQEEQQSQFSGTQKPVYKTGSVIEALKVQKRDTLNIVPESYVEQTNHMDEAQRLLLKAHDFMKGLDENWSYNYTTSNNTGPVISFGSETYQRNNSYPESNGQDVYGSEDVLIGNIFPDNPNGTNVYGPVDIQENNIYRGDNKNAQYGPSITQIGNTYPENAGKNDIYTAVVVQKSNIYEGNPENKTMVGVIINQSNNTYSKSIEANKDALKPIIHRSGNIYRFNKNSGTVMDTKNNTEYQIDSHYTTSNKTGPVRHFGSQVYQRNNSYPESNGQNVHGSENLQIGNTFTDNPNVIHAYGANVIQENNTYRGNDALYGASVTQIGKTFTYSENAGENDINTTVVVQKNNIYGRNPENREAYADKRTVSNSQTSSSFNVFSLHLYYFVVLFKYSLFDS